MTQLASTSVKPEFVAPKVQELPFQTASFY